MNQTNRCKACQTVAIGWRVHWNVKCYLLMNVKKY